jgi:hypothetical protein
MPIASLLLAILLPAASATAQPVATPAVAVSNEPQAQTFAVAPPTLMSEAEPQASDDVCYKIRAYIFKRDDDHAPELVRSTTCGPRKPHTKAADWPKAKLVPAN